MLLDTIWGHMGNPPIQPDIRAALATLLDLFLVFARSRSERERERLTSQILDIFESLGTTSEQLVRDARTQFEVLRSEVPPRAPRINQLEASAKDLVKARIRRFESLSWNLKLTKGAKEMLRIPVIETTSLNGTFDASETSESVDRILETMRIQDPSQIHSRNRTSVDVIRSLHQNFCNIPPFCSGR